MSAERPDNEMIANQPNEKTFTTFSQPQ